MNLSARVSCAVVLLSVLGGVGCLSSNASQAQEFVYREGIKQLKTTEGNERVLSYVRLVSRVLRPDQRRQLMEQMAREYPEGTSNEVGRAAYLLGLGISHSHDGDFTRALATLEQARPMVEACEHRFPTIRFHWLFARAGVLYSRGEWEQCISDSQAALTVADNCESPLPLHLPYRMLGLVAAKFKIVAEAVDYHGKELAYGIQLDDPYICGSAVQKIVGVLQKHGGGENDLREIRSWLARGEVYLRQSNHPRLQILFARRRAQLAVDTQSNADIQIRKFAQLLESNYGALRGGEASTLNRAIGRLYRGAGNLDAAYRYAKKSRQLAKGASHICDCELQLALIELSRNELESAKERLDSIGDAAAGTRNYAVRWHKLAAQYFEKRREFEDAFEHQKIASELETVARNAVLRIQISCLGKLHERQQLAAQEELAREKQNHEEARADIAEKHRNAIAFASVVALLGLVVMFRLRLVSRIKRETEKMNDRLALELDERTEQLEAESDRRHQLELDTERKQRHEAIGLLAAGVSHDFNNLLTVITNSHEALKFRGDLEPSQHKILELASDATGQASGVVHQLMSYAKQEPLHVQDVSLAKWFRSSQTLLSSTLGEDIRFETECGHATAVVSLDESQLTTAMINLVSNARDALANSTDPCVSVSIQRHDSLDGAPDSELGWVRITVKDNGSGIDQDLLPTVLNPYVTTKDGTGTGTGLGLSMVAGFVDRAGGVLQIQSDPKTGTRVAISFPCVANIEREENQPGTATLAISGKTVLLVDDNDLVRSTTASLLRSVNFDVIEVDSGDEAAVWLENHDAPLIVLSDITMPGRLNGIALRQHVLQQYPGITVVLMTGRTSQDIDPGTRVIQKPFQLSALLATLETALAH